ncbi:MAG: LptA/OstA family protein [Nitrospirota bacterium]
MKKLAAVVLVIACSCGARVLAQTAAATPKAVTAAPKAVAVAPKAVAATSPKKQKKQPADKQNKSPAESLFGQSALGLNTKEPTTTEIYADEAFFDSTKNMGIFSGRVKVTDPRFNLQSDKLTVFITKGENQGLEKAIAEGNVGLIRDRPDPSGGPPTRAVGRADKATYTAATGDVELRGTPRVQEGPNMHVATSPDTVMIINQNSQLTTHGPSRTEIRQEPSDDQAKEKKREAKKAAAQATPAQAAPSGSVPAAALPTP